MDSVSGNGGEGGFKDNLQVIFWPVELDGRWYHPWIRKHWRRAKDKADVTLWTGLRLLTTDDSLLPCPWRHYTYPFMRGGGKCPLFVWLAFEAFEAWSLRWEWAGSQEPFCSHFTANFGTLAKELPWNSVALLWNGLYSQMPNPAHQAIKRRKWESNFKWGRCQVSFTKMYWWWFLEVRGLRDKTWAYFCYNKISVVRTTFFLANEAPD